MKKTTAQNKAEASSGHSLSSSLYQIAQNLLGSRQLLHEFSTTAAHYDGLIDCVERAGWDLSKLEQVKHAFDTMSQNLLTELVESHPDMSDREQQSFLAPFQVALHQFAGLNQREKAMFRAEYQRFTQLQAETVQQFAASDSRAAS